MTTPTLASPTRRRRASQTAAPALAATGGSSITLAGLSHILGGRPVLSDITLDIPAGQFIAVVGRSGSGKSTLLRLLGGLEAPRHGQIAFGATSRDEVRLMFQDARLLPWLSVLDNVALGLPKARLADAQAALAEVGLADRAHTWPTALSGGQRQRVALARALVHRPQVLLLDEPLGALDALTRQEMQALIERLHRFHQFTIVLVTHDISEAITLADRVLLIEHGAISLDLTLDLPHPRDRADARFSHYETAVTSHIVGDTTGTALPTPLQPTAPAQLHWAV